jgi:hypothetical protein
MKFCNGEGQRKEAYHRTQAGCGYLLGVLDMSFGLNKK